MEKWDSLTLFILSARLFRKDCCFSISLMIKAFHNEPLVRTRFSFFAGILSESDSHSDSFLFYYRIPVRIGLPFGLISLLLQDSCPYQTPFQTRFSLLQDSCPNQTPIRTHLAIITGFLSESGSHSDSITSGLTTPLSKKF